MSSIVFNGYGKLGYVFISQSGSGVAWCNMETDTSLNLSLPRMDTSLVMSILLLLPIIVASFPIILSYLQDHYPSGVKQGNPIYILFSPYLDRKGIQSGAPPKKILHDAIQQGTEKMVDEIVDPVLVPVKGLQEAVGQSIGAIRDGIHDGISVPTRAMFKMGTGLTGALMSAFQSAIGSISGIFTSIRHVIENLISGALVGLYFQTASFNLTISGMKFFLFIVEIAGIAVTALGMVFMASLFLIPVGIPLVVIGAILTAIAVESEGVMRMV